MTQKTLVAKSFVIAIGILLLGVMIAPYAMRDNEPAPRVFVQEERVQTKQVHVSATTTNRKPTASIILTIDGGFSDSVVVITPGKSMLGLLQELTQHDPDIGLTTKDYAGLGTLVTAMYGKVNGSGQKYWQYRVNGIMPQIGADRYIPTPGDRIEWFFAASAE